MSSLGAEVSGFLSGTWGRLVRSGVSLALGFAVSKYQNNVWYISLTPFLQTSSKWLRDKYPGAWEWLPF